MTLALQWPGCPQALAVLDSMSSSGTESPSGCFTQTPDLQAGLNPGSFVIAPVDRGVNCTLNGILSLNAIGGYSLADSGAAYTIPHNTTPARLGGVMLASAPTSAILSTQFDDEFLVDLIMAGVSTPVSLQAVQLDVGGKITNPSATSSLATSLTTWTAQLISWVFTGTSLVSASLSAAPPANTGVQNWTATDGSTSLQGSIPALPVSGNFYVRAATSSSFAGSAPLLVVGNGTSLSLAYIPSNSSNSILGQSLTTVPLPNTPPDNATLVRIASLFINNQEAVVVMLQYGTQVSYNYALVNTNSALTFNWAPTETISDSIVDLAVINNSNVISLSSLGSVNVNVLSLPTYNGSAWSGSIGYAYGGTTGLTVPFALVPINGQMYATGKNSANQFEAVLVSYSGETF
ncbi:unnamed protein product [Sphagnum balticum]